ncbi:MAG: hypothetical protein ABI462_06420 [Ignavibacteria bacterium]
MNINEKLSAYFQRKAAEDPSERFQKQVKGSFISTAVIIGVVFILIVVLVLINAVSSLFK